MKDFIKEAQEYATRIECKGCIARGLPTCEFSKEGGSPCEEHQLLSAAWINGHTVGFKDGQKDERDRQNGKNRMESLEKEKMGLIKRSIELEDKVKEMQVILDLNDRIVEELRSQIKEMERTIKFFNAAKTEEAINEACRRLENVLK